MRCEIYSWISTSASHIICKLNITTSILPSPMAYGVGWHSFRKLCTHLPSPKWTFVMDVAIRWRTFPNKLIYPYGYAAILWVVHCQLKSSRSDLVKLVKLARSLIDAD